MDIEPEEHIRVRAYFIWKNDGCPQGCDLTHWFQAKQEVVSTLEAIPLAIVPEKKVAKPRSVRAAQPKQALKANATTAGASKAGSAKAEKPKAATAKAAKNAAPKAAASKLEKTPALAAVAATEKPRSASRPVQVALN